MTNQIVLAGFGLFFSLATAGLALLLLPQARAAANIRVEQWRTRSRSACAATAHAFRDGARSAAGVSAAGRSVLGALWARRAQVAGASTLVAGAPVLALLLRGWMPVESFDHMAARAVDERVLAALQGEQLVLPIPLPPELFVTRELESARPMIQYASREWALLDDQFRQRLLLVFRRMRELHGYELVLLEGYRSPQRQAQLAALGPKVTRAGAWDSYHQHGLAADVAFIRDGRIVISESNPWARRGYERYGEVAESFGLTWGGSWHDLVDYGHVEWRRAGALNAQGKNAEARAEPMPEPMPAPQP